MQLWRNARVLNSSLPASQPLQTMTKNEGLAAQMVTLMVGNHDKKKEPHRSTLGMLDGLMHCFGRDSNPRKLSLRALETRPFDRSGTKACYYRPPLPPSLYSSSDRHPNRSIHIPTNAQPNRLPPFSPFSPFSSQSSPLLSTSYPS